MNSKTDSTLLYVVFVVYVSSMATTINASTSSKLQFNLFHKLHFLDPAKSALNDSDVNEQWFEQRLDHYNPQIIDIWPQRYFSSFEYYEDGGPIFLQIGGEGEASPSWLSYGAWIEWAKEQKAALFILEHRFYGKSRPTDSLKLDYLHLLSSRQAINDVANFIDSMTKEHGFAGPWISFGGSYSGSLSAWAREKYPHLVKGSVSSSGPLNAKVNFLEYLEVVYESIESRSSKCNMAISQGINSLETLLDDPSKWVELQDMFHLCTPFDGSFSEDKAVFMANIVGIIEVAVQYDWNGAINIEDICSIMDNEGLGTPLERLTELNEYYLSMNGENYCMDYRYQTMIEQLNQTDYGSGFGYRQWTYQTCSEFGWFDSSDQPGHPYGTKIDIKWAVKMCNDVYGDIFGLDYIETLVQETNDYYGSIDLDVQNVVFVHGSIDPWHAMGRVIDLNEDSPAIMITGTSHCVDMYSNEPDDPKELIEARARIGSLVAKWVEGSKDSTSF